MKKGIIVLIVVILLVITVFVLARLFHSKPVGPNPPIESGEINTPVVQDAAAKVRVEAVTVRNKTDNIDIHNVYPTITSFKNKEFENYINKQIASAIAEYRTEINSMVDDETPDVKLYKYVTSYTKNTWGNYLTLVVTQDYQTGGIRSNRWKDIYNIDVSTERIIYLADLFEPGVAYENAIISEITRQAALKGYQLMGGEGISKLPTKQKFYIQDGKLIIYFDPAEVAATSYGALEFEMPFTLNNNGFFEVE